MSENVFGAKKIKVIRKAGDLNSVYLEEDGVTVFRSPTITIQNMGTFPCAPYDNHFLFRHEFIKKGKVTRNWTLFCTCGSPAAVVGYDAYAKDASASGAMVVCMHHATYNKHADSST